MMRFEHLVTRLKRLEARTVPRAPVGYTHPEPSDAWVAEVWQLLLDYGHFASEEALLDALQEYAREAL